MVAIDLTARGDEAVAGQEIDEFNSLDYSLIKFTSQVNLVICWCLDPRGVYGEPLVFG